MAGTGPSPSESSGSIKMPRAIVHRTKAQTLAAIDVPNLNDGPLRALEEAQAAKSPSGKRSEEALQYDDQSLLQDIARDKGHIDDRRAELIRLLRRHNYSLPSLVGQVRDQICQ